MPKILALDISLQTTGFVILSSAGRSWGVTHAKTKVKMADPMYHMDTIRRAEKQWADLKEQIEDSDPKGKPDMVVVELPVGTAKENKYTKFQTAVLTGLLKYWIREEYGIADILEINPGTMKRYLTGKGNSPKSIMVATLIEEFDISTTHFGIDAEHVADAYVMARMCWDTFVLVTGHANEREHYVKMDRQRILKKGTPGSKSVAGNIKLVQHVVPIAKKLGLEVVEE